MSQPINSISIAPDELFLVRAVPYGFRMTVISLCYCWEAEASSVIHHPVLVFLPPLTHFPFSLTLASLRLSTPP